MPASHARRPGRLVGRRGPLGRSAQHRPGRALVAAHRNGTRRTRRGHPPGQPAALEAPVRHREGDPAHVRRGAARCGAEHGLSRHDRIHRPDRARASLPADARPALRRGRDHGRADPRAERRPVPRHRPGAARIAPVLGLAERPVRRAGPADALSAAPARPRHARRCARPPRHRRGDGDLRAGWRDRCTGRRGGRCLQRRPGLRLAGLRRRAAAHRLRTAASGRPCRPRHARPAVRGGGQRRGRCAAAHRAGPSAPGRRAAVRASAGRRCGRHHLLRGLPRRRQRCGPVRPGAAGEGRGGPALGRADELQRPQCQRPGNAGHGHHRSVAGARPGGRRLEPYCRCGAQLRPEGLLRAGRAQAVRRHQPARCAATGPAALPHSTPRRSS